jgi:AAA ATPase domain
VDRVKNPFSPGAGSPPPELCGRGNVLEDARVLLARTKLKKAEKSIILTGLRGVGKTVLLVAMERVAKEQEYHTIFIEAVEGKSLALLLSPYLKKLLFELDAMAGVGDKARRAITVLKSFVSAVKVKIGDFDIGIDIEPQIGSADSGDLEVDLPNLFVAVAQAAQERNTAVLILIDEIQYFDTKELSALIMAMHKLQQQQLPLVLVAAGLPILPALAGESKSYAERLFGFPNIGALSKEDSFRALQDPVKKESVWFDEDALGEIFRLARGYPYFLQEWGYQAWNQAVASPIGLEVVKIASDIVIKRLDENFFRVRFDRLTPKEKEVLRAMAEFGGSPSRTSDIAEKLSWKISTLSPVRDSLIKKGMVYSPSHGDLAFTVPLFDEFMKRVAPT